MSFTYINPGYAEWLDGKSSTTVENLKYNPYGGVAFYGGSTDRSITLPEIPAEIYIHLLLYIDLTKGSNGRVIISAGNSNGLDIQETWGNWELNFECNDSKFKTMSVAEANLKLDGMNELLFHCKAGTNEAGLYSWVINGVEVIAENRSVSFIKSGNYATKSDEVVLFSTNARAVFSNIIISDAEVREDEKVAVLPASAVDTDMTDNGDGSYSATVEGQYFLQTLDADDLISSYGGASTVTGLYLSGNPAYATGAVLRKAIACGGKDGNISDIAEMTLKADPASKAMIGGKVSMTLEDLRGYKFGWKAGV